MALTVNRPLGIIPDKEALTTSRGRVTKKFLLAKYGPTYTQEFYNNVDIVLNQALQRTYNENPESETLVYYRDLVRNSSPLFAKMTEKEIEKTVDDMSFHLNQIKEGRRLNSPDALKVYAWKDLLPNMFPYDEPLSTNICSDPPEVGYDDLTDVFN